MQTLANKRILLGVTGGIAAYKSAELVRRLREKGAEVRVVMTRAAREFITPMTMQVLSGNPVHTELLDHDAEAAMGHIELARWSDLVLVAPATANFIARLAHGLADDLLTTLCLAADVPLVVAPAMNRQMWLNAATRANVALIGERGITILGPAAGEQACGETGPGRMLEPPELVAAVESQFQTSLLTGTHVMVTAGPTREAIDPVRFISNRSSGRMGYALARAALEAGARVTLISGPSPLEPPQRAHYINVNTAAEMYETVMANIQEMDIFIATAAVADYRCENIADQKLKKSGRTLTLALERNPDILAEVAGLPRAPFTVGFAAETEAVKQNAQKKLRRKGVDMIAANRVGDGMGFESDQNSLDVFWKNGNLSLGLSSKEKVARRLIRLVAERFHEKSSDQIH